MTCIADQTLFKTFFVWLIFIPDLDLIKYHTLVAVYKCTHGLVPSYLHNTSMQISHADTATPPGRQIKHTCTQDNLS